MTKELTTIILQLTIISPILFLCLKKDCKKGKLIILFYVFFILNSILLRLPGKIESLDFIGGNWNWTGKMFSIFGSIIFYLLFKKFYSGNDFIKVKQEKGSLKSNIITTIIILIVMVVMSIFMYGKSDVTIETFGFQLTMPGFDEELAYRGIMLGILTTILIDKIKIGKINIGSPAIWITAILFGLIHGLSFNKEWSLHMEWSYFAYTCAYGFVLGWMTLKSRSILMPIISHNLTNFTAYLVMFLK